MSESKWIEFEEVSHHLKTGVPRVTKKWKVQPKDQPMMALGEIKWYGAWRCYAFFPNTATLYEKQCLRDIADFCEQQTIEHRERRKAEKNL